MSSTSNESNFMCIYIYIYYVFFMHVVVLWVGAIMHIYFEAEDFPQFASSMCAECSKFKAMAMASKKK